jgi:uncharacterized OsmC-like protein
MSVAHISEALDKVGKLIAEQPEKAKAKNAPATAKLLEGLRCEVKGPNGETAYTDMTRAMGGAASAPNPSWLFRAAVASCTSTAIAMRAAKQGISLTTLEVTVESSSDSRGLLGLDEKVSAGLSQIVCRVKIGADGVAPERLRELAEWGDRHSPIACTTRNTPDFAIEIEVA